MRLFGQLFGQDQYDSPELLSAIERAVAAVDPRLRQISGYPEQYRKPVATALVYAQHLAASVPGPVVVDRESYARDGLVHALFPDINYINEAVCSSLALRDYLRDFPASDELYALMGMRRFEKTVVGMELSGEVVQHDVVQKAVYFNSHTIDHPAPNELQARALAAMSFFDSLTGKVRQRVEQRKQAKQSLLLEKDQLLARLRIAGEQERPALDEALAGILARLGSTVSSLELGNYVADFDAVLLHPEEYLRLDTTPIMMDSMGIRRAADDIGRGKAILFNDLIGYDRRDWTVTMVRCSNLQNESFAAKLDKAYRKLAF